MGGSHCWAAGDRSSKNQATPSPSPASGLAGTNLPVCVAPTGQLNQESLSHHLTQSCHLWLLLETSLECEHRLVGTLERWCAIPTELFVDGSPVGLVREQRAALVPPAAVAAPPVRASLRPAATRTSVTPCSRRHRNYIIFQARARNKGLNRDSRLQTFPLR